MRTKERELTKDIIRNYVLENINFSQLDDNFDIFDAGIVNSLFAIELMTFLEKAFNIKITMEDLDMENFKSIYSTCEFVERKQVQNA